MVSFEGDIGIVLLGTMELSSKYIYVWWSVLFNSTGFLAVQKGCVFFIFLSGL